MKVVILYSFPGGLSFIPRPFLRKRTSRAASGSPPTGPLEDPRGKALRYHLARWLHLIELERERALRR